MQILVIDSDYRLPRQLKTLLRNYFRDVVILHVERVEDLRAQVSEQWKSSQTSALSATSSEASPTAHSDITSGSRSTPWPAQSFALDLKPHDLNLIDIHFLSEDSTGQSIMGYDQQRFRQRPDFWRSLVAFEDRREFAEGLKRAQREGHGQGQVRLLDSDGRLHTAIWRSRFSGSDNDTEKLMNRKLSIEFQSEPSADTSPEVVNHPILDLVFVASDQLPIVSLSSDFAILRSALGPFGPDGEAPPIIASSHDLSELERQAFLQAQIADVIFKPIDEALLLQKISRLIPNAPRQDQSEFLFSLKGDFAFDLGEELMVNGFNDLGVRLTHKKPLRTGRRIRVRTPILNPIGTSSTRSDVIWLHVCSSGARADGENVRTDTTFFGLPSDSRATLRSKLEASLGPAFHKPRVQPDPKPKQARPTFIVHGDEPKLEPHRVFINLDLDEESQDRLQQMTEVSYPKHRVMSFDTPSMALQIFRQQTQTSTSPATPTNLDREVRPAFFPNHPLEIRLTFEKDTEDYRLTEVISTSVDKAMLFGFPAKEVMDTQNFFDKQCDETERWRDFLRFVVGGQKASRIFRMISKFETFYEIRVEAQLRSGDLAETSLELKLVDVTSQTQSLPELQSVDTSLVDAVVIDAAYFRNEISPLIQALRQSLKSNDVRFIVTGRPSHGLTIDDFANCSDVSAFVPKPLDRRALESALNHNTNLSEPIEHRKSWVDYLRKIRVDTIGEYGLEFTSPSPIAIGAWAHFANPLLQDEGGRGILGRCFASDPIEARLYRHRFLFYAVRDEALRKLRVFLKMPQAGRVHR